MRPDLRQPFFQLPGAARPRLLLISYHFPPGQAAGALRWQKLSRYVAERGWNLDVVTLHPSSLASPDTGRLDDLPAGTRVFGVPRSRTRIGRINDLLVVASKRVRSRTVRRNAAPASPGTEIRPKPGSIPTDDLRWLIRNRQELKRTWNTWVELADWKRWGREATAVALDVVDPGSHRAIVTCGPPHVEHLAGRQVARRTGLPLIMDFRDPWSIAAKLPEPVASRLWLHLTARDERRTVADASLIVLNTERLKIEMERLYPNLRDRFLTVMNGHDEDEEPPPPPEPGRPFVIAYAGSIYIDRDPRPLFRAAARVVRELQLDPSTFRIEFKGHVQQLGGVPTEALARQEGLDGFFTAHPHGSRREVQEFLARATMLVSLPQDAEKAIPSKVFEYMQYHAWLLIFANPGSAPALLLEDSDADVVDPRDSEQLVSVLRRRICQYRQGTIPERMASDGRFSRREQARRLLDAIEGTVDD